MSSYFAYCVYCLQQPTKANAYTGFYDYRFDTPVCLDCVEVYRLEPDEEEVA